jgi:hypothetical protein
VISTGVHAVLSALKSNLLPCSPEPSLSSLSLLWNCVTAELRASAGMEVWHCAVPASLRAFVASVASKFFSDCAQR